MNLKDVIKAEAASVFLNPNEFGDIMIVDGIDTVGIWDDVVQTAPAFYGANMDTWGVNTVERLLYVCAKDVPCPTSGQQLDINGVLWLVKDARNTDGMLQLTLYRNED